MLGEILAGFVRAVFLDNLGFDRILQGRFAGARAWARARRRIRD